MNDRLRTKDIITSSAHPSILVNKKSSKTNKNKKDVKYYFDILPGRRQDKLLSYNHEMDQPASQPADH